MKKIIALVVVIGLFIMPVASSNIYYDVNSESQGGRAIYAMSEKGIISGYGNGFFGPLDTLTRAQAVKIINKVFKYETPCEISFTDVKSENWFYNDVAIAVNAGYIKGYGEGIFAPNDTLTREQVCVMLDNIMDFVMLPLEVEIKDEVSPWAEESVKKILSNCLAETDESGNFRGKHNMTREEACLMLSQFVIDELPVIKPFDLAEIEREELEERLKRVIKGVREDLIKRSDDPIIQNFIELIAKNLERYLSDPAYNYKAEVENTRKIFRTLPDEQMDYTKKIMIEFFMDERYVEDMNILYEFFF